MKDGLRSKITKFVKKGVERHQKARAAGKVPEKRVKQFAKGFSSGVKDTVKFAGKVKKVVSNESVGSAVDKTLSATADVAKVAGKVATGGVKVASKVAKGAAKTAATVVGTPVGVVKSIGKGFKSGTSAESRLSNAQLQDISEILSQIDRKQSGLPEHHQVDDNGKVIEHEDTVDEGIIGKAIQGVGKVVGGAENAATGAVKKTADAAAGVVKGTAGAAKKVVKTVGGAVSGGATSATRKEGYQRDPDQQKKDRNYSKQPDPSEDDFTGIGNMTINDIMKMNKKIKAKSVKKESYVSESTLVRNLLEGKS